MGRKKLKLGPSAKARRTKELRDKRIDKKKLKNLQEFVTEVIALHNMGATQDFIAEILLDNGVRVLGFDKETFDRGIDIKTV